MLETEISKPSHHLMKTLSDAVIEDMKFYLFDAVIG